MNLREDILAAARADSIPAGEDGLWIVRKTAVKSECPVFTTDDDGRKIINESIRIAPGNYTGLFCVTDATIHVGGEMVMNDTAQELSTHLNFMLRARGKVLITGLGLGCCLRGALANPAVSHVTLVERSESVIKLVWPYIRHNGRATLIHDDAIAWVKRTRRKFDVAWHDLWSMPAEPKLSLQHSKLILGMHSRATDQGAWAFPREAKKVWNKMRLRLGRTAML